VGGVEQEAGGEEGGSVEGGEEEEEEGEGGGEGRRMRGNRIVRMREWRAPTRMRKGRRWSTEREGGREGGRTSRVYRDACVFMYSVRMRSVWVCESE